MRPGFVRIPRTNGKPAVVRADAITALLPQTVKEKGTGEEKEELTIQIGQSVVIHTTLSADVVARLVQNATGIPMVIVEPTE